MHLDAQALSHLGRACPRCHLPSHQRALVLGELGSQKTQRYPKKSQRTRMEGMSLTAKVKVIL